MTVYLFPGQGSQFKGMGEGLFAEFPRLSEQASEILGYSIEELCLADREAKLAQTEFTQPALFVVNALTYLKRAQQGGATPDFVAGHSLGEYDALFAAGVFDFKVGVQLVKRRGELMSKAPAGGMAAIVNCSVSTIRHILDSNGLAAIDIANFNSPKQTVLSGPVSDLQRAQPLFEQVDAMFIPLNVSAPFHSRYMRPVVLEFESFLRGFRFSPPRIPVVANCSARLYREDNIYSNLTEQLCSSVQWTDSVRFLLGKGQSQFEEIGPGNVLTKLVKVIVNQADPLIERAQTSDPDRPRPTEAPAAPLAPSAPRTANADNSVGQTLGSAEFMKEYGVRYAYVAGAMYNGIASKELVVRMAKAGLLAFLGTGGMKAQSVEASIAFIQQQVNDGGSYGMNLIHTPHDQTKEMSMVDLFLTRGIKVIEASAFIQMTPALVKFRLRGLEAGPNGEVERRLKVIAKVSRPEVARLFLSPAPDAIVKRLLHDGQITQTQAELSSRVPMADDICAEADSAGHTDGAIPTVLLPSMLRLRDAVCREHGFSRKVRVGAAGGIGTPEAAAAAFVLGADFVLTGSINQCTVEAATSDQVKDMLQELDIQDTDYAPAGDMFEIGAKVQVMKRGVFFASRANKLFSLWSQYADWKEIDAKTRTQLEERYFRRSFDSIFEEMKTRYAKTRPSEIEEAERSGKRKMALVFRWYFVNSSRVALAGDERFKVDYQVHTGPAMGAFNQWVKGTELENWRNRHVDVIGKRLMDGAAALLNAKYVLREAAH